MSLASAIDLACSVHKGQLYGNKPYILHPLRVMESVLNKFHDLELAEAAVLHDVVEDSPEEVDLSAFSGRVQKTVQSITRKKDESYSNYISRLTYSASIIKYFDIQDHLSHEDTLPESLKERYENALVQLENNKPRAWNSIHYVE